MPYKNVKRYTRSPAILAHNNANYFTKSITLENTNVPLDDNDERTIPSGAIVSKVDGKYRFLPRVKSRNSIGTGNAEVDVTNPFSLMKNDKLYVVMPYEAISVDTAGADSDTLTITLDDDIQVEVNVTSTEANDKGKQADLIAKTVNNDLQASQKVHAVSDENDTVWILQNNIFDRSTLATSASGSIIVSFVRNSGNLRLNNTAIGTVSSIDRVNQKVTLTSNAGLSVPADVSIGVRNAEMIGVIVEDYDMTIANVQNLAPCTHSMGIYKNRLPHYDEDVDYQLENITFGNKF